MRRQFKMRIKRTELLSGAQSGDDKFEQLGKITVEALKNIL